MDTFSGAELLTPEENLFGRVLIRNGLATKEQVEAAAKTAINGPADSLQEALVNQEVINASMIEIVKSAIEKKLQERGLSTASFAPPGASGVLDPVKPEQLRKTPPNLNGREEGMQALVKRLVRSRLHRQLLEHIIADQMGVLSAATLSKRLSVEPRRVMEVFLEWKEEGVVRSTPETRFLFSPTPEELLEMRELMRLWTNGRTHSKVLGWILGEELG